MVNALSSKKRYTFYIILLQIVFLVNVTHDGRRRAKQTGRVLTHFRNIIKIKMLDLKHRRSPV